MQSLNVGIFCILFLFQKREFKENYDGNKLDRAVAAFI